MIKEFLGIKPQIDESAYVAESAIVIGNVSLGKNVSVWENAVLRGDINKIVIGEGSNVQDNCTVHVDIDFPVIIGKNVTIGHNAIIHGAQIGNNVVVGMGSTLLNGCAVGDNVIIGACTLITGGKIVAERTVVVGNPFRELRTATEADILHTMENAKAYTKLLDYVKKT